MDRMFRAGVLLAVFGLTVIEAPTVMSPSLHADDGVVDLNNPDAIRRTLELQAGKRVKLRLVSGQEMEGKVARVGTQALVLAEVAGMEFFDATVSLDQIAAVLVRVRSR